MYSSMQCGVCAFMRLFTSVSPISLHVLVYKLTTCTCLHTHYMYLSTYSLQVLVYILTTCTCLHTHYMYLSTYSLHILVCSQPLSVVNNRMQSDAYVSTYYCIPIDQTPSDIGLLAVWNEVPKWELPLNLGVSLTDVDSLRQGGKDGIEALHIWRNGRCKGFPPTWTSLLNAVERVEGPQVRQKLSANVGVDKTWTQCK